MLSGRDQNALFHQTGGITYAGDVPADGLHLKTVEIDPAEDYAGSSGSGKNAQPHWGTGVQADPVALDDIADCLFPYQI